MADHQPRLSAFDIIHQLSEGNTRFIQGIRTADTSPNQRIMLKQGQTPIATVFACSDSRVAPEFIFDQGLGQLFVVRTAGVLLDTLSLASLEYGCLHLHTPLLLLLGHTRCGATTAACESAPQSDNCSPIRAQLRPLVRSVKTMHPLIAGQDLIEATSLQNLRRLTTWIPQQSPLIANAIHQGSLVVKTALYHLETGAVEFLSLF